MSDDKLHVEGYIDGKKVEGDIKVGGGGGSSDDRSGCGGILPFIIISGIIIYFIIFFTVTFPKVIFSIMSLILIPISLIVVLICIIKNWHRKLQYISLALIVIGIILILIQTVPTLIIGNALFIISLIIPRMKLFWKLRVFK